MVDLSYPNSKTRRGRVQEGGSVSPTITAESNGLCVIEEKPTEPQIRIRKLTPLETWRLMDFDDKDFWKAHYGPDIPFEIAQKIEHRTVTKAEWKKIKPLMRKDYVSNSQLYKQSGNSIVVNCLVAIFGQMFDGREDTYRTREKWTLTG